MSSFTTPLVVTPMPDGRRWKLVFPFRYHIGYRYNKDVIIVPKDFVTDFASVPKLFWSFLPNWGKYGKAAVIHDYLYQFLSWMLKQPQFKPLFDHFYQARENPRKWADQIFLEAMLVSGTKPWKAKLMYRAVRMFSWIAWKK